MAKSYFWGPTLDDVLRIVIEEIFANGKCIHPKKGPCKELTGVLLEIENPSARLSRTETKGKLFSCLGELCWYLAKSNELSFISYYIPKYKDSADGSSIYGGYGPRLFNWRGKYLFNWKGINQIAQVISDLAQKRDTRQAVIQIFDAKDIIREHKDVPCTCVMQFLKRDSQLNMITYMRSNDVFLGLPHDIFCFTMIQEIVARTLSVDPGYYKHSVGSIHLYEDNFDDAVQYLGEGWQSTDIKMPPMPIGDPWPAIKLLLKAESTLRTTGQLTIDLCKLNPYWVDLVRLLQIYRSWKDKDIEQAIKLRDSMSSNIYKTFIDTKLGLR